MFSMDLSLFDLLFVFILLRESLMAIMDFEKELVRGKHLIIGTLDLPPYTIITKRNPIQVDGFVHQILSFLAQKFEFTYEYVEPAYGYTGNCNNNTDCNGLIGMLVRGEIDMAATGLAMTFRRTRVVDFTFAFQSDPLSLLIPYPRRESTIDGITDPFTFEVWIFVLISLVVCSFFLLWIGNTEVRFIRQYNADEIEIESSHRGVGYHLMFLLSVLVNPGNRYPPGFGIAFKLLVGAWCVYATVITNSYTTSLKSFITMPRYLPGIRTLGDLVQSTEYNFVAQKYTSLWANIMTATSGVYLKVGNSLREHPEHSFENLTEDNDIIINHKYILGQLKSMNLMRIERDLKTRGGECRLHLGEDFEETRIGFGIPKNSPFLNHLLSHEFIWMRQSGLLSKWASFYWPRTNRCSAPVVTEPPRTNEKLTLSNLFGAFLLLGVGIIISLVAFALELLVSCRCKRNYRRQSLNQDSATSPIVINQFNTVDLTRPNNSNLDEVEQFEEPDQVSSQTIPKIPVHDELAN